jgi:hypothetical protein
VEQNQSPQSLLTATPSALSAFIYHSCPFPFFSAAATAAVVVMVNFFIPCHTHCQEVLVAGQPVTQPTTYVQAQAGGLAFAPGGSATNDAMSIPTALTCFRSRGGAPYH